MEVPTALRRLALIAAISAFGPAGCLTDRAGSPLTAKAACPDGLALRLEGIGLSYAIVRVDSCAAHAGRFELEHSIDGDSAREVFVIDEHTGWFMSAKYPIFPGSVSRYRVTAYFPDSTRLQSATVSLDYPDSSGDFAPIEEGQSYAYAYGHHAGYGSNGIMPDTSEQDTGIFSFQVLSRRDSSGVAVFRIGYRDSIVRALKPYPMATNSPWDIKTTLSNDTLRCVDDGDSLYCDPARNGVAGMRFPWARGHIQRAPYAGMIMPAGGAATSCAYETNRILPYGEGSQAVYLPGIGLIQAWESSFTPQSRGFGSRTQIRLLAFNGAAVEYRAHADLCSRDFPPYPAP